jgi:hypothetical protein
MRKRHVPPVFTCPTAWTPRYRAMDASSGLRRPHGDPQRYLSNCSRWLWQVGPIATLQQTIYFCNIQMKHLQQRPKQLKHLHYKKYVAFLHSIYAKIYETKQSSAQVSLFGGKRHKAASSTQGRPLRVARAVQVCWPCWSGWATRLHPHMAAFAGWASLQIYFCNIQMRHLVHTQHACIVIATCVIFRYTFVTLI